MSDASQQGSSATGSPRYVGDCRICHWPCYEGLSHHCTTVPRVGWEKTASTWEKP